MGGKLSKKGSETVLQWSLPDEECFAVADLERSTTADRLHNNLGLPDDVLGYIASFLVTGEIEEKKPKKFTKDRMCATSAVWRRYARRGAACR